MTKPFIHTTAEVSDRSKIGEDSKVWNWVQIRENVIIGKECIIGKGAYIDEGVRIGNNVKIQNNVSVYNGVEIEDGVFVGPHVCFTNDRNPRAVTSDGKVKSAEDWTVAKTLVKKGASIGANSTIIAGIAIGRYALIGAGSVVTKDVKDFSLVFGNPARQHGYVCRCGIRLDEKRRSCDVCNTNLDDVVKD